MLKRYASIDYVLNLEYSEGIKLIQKAIEETQKDRLFMLYTSIYPFFNADNFISFEDFYNSCIIKEVNNNKTVEEIMKETRDLYYSQKSWEVR